ncbi:urea carboxylase [Hydrogenovibrio sp. 3SP14C1]|uniref:urea carboxylase n=1 Tax=Hydrogenovibrio sp. 3SP14C1 TaxID=3038774 RepID=UPI002415F374|nr:urea carboxylase [Hydrogenovibrio sp. 3SP14C1]MDG4812708.1 urea carboxylase [Hydrogenovibrio sp. 3SP14C1]
MFKKILIANRGAIATRIIRTLKQMNIQSVVLASDADRASLHVQQANEVIFLKGNVATETYLNVPLILEKAQELGVEAIHPGYGFLSENDGFAETCESMGIKFIGPAPDHIRDFGLKHTARELAIKANVPLLPGSDLLSSLEEAQQEADRIGFPVMLKSTAGGGGIGMQRCDSPEDLSEAFDQVARLSQNSFGQSGIFLEKFVVNARHIEIQIFGDGLGKVVSFGERDCSLQRRNQKVVEETPAVGISRTQVAEMEAHAVRLGELVNYQSAGTVEYVYDADTNQYYFLEVNTRLQVEHGITEAVRDVDLVQWMIQVAYNQTFPEAVKPARGHAIEVRVYAEDPFKNFQPSSGKLTGWKMPTDCRVDTWCTSGQDVSSYYDPMLAKIIVKSDDRETAVHKLQTALDETRIDGFETNIIYLAALSHAPAFIKAENLYTQFLNGFSHQPNTVEITNPGTHSMLVSYPGRLGYWDIGVPPSGPMDALSHRLANRCLNNDENAATIEMTVSGVSLKFDRDTVICITGADINPTLDKQPIPQNEAVSVKAGQLLKSKVIKSLGQRAYLAVKGGFDVPDYMGSKTTFSLGGFGGHAGRLLRAGDVLHLSTSVDDTQINHLPSELIPELTNYAEIAVIYGPQGCPDFFTEEDIDTFFATDWEVHYNSSRTGIRLNGPKPNWARTDGGEAGLHPSNIHDNAYAIGAIDFTGDMPVILAQDGPSLGGFVCPATIIEAEQWKMGQLRPGDKIRFKPVSTETAEAALKAQEAALQSLTPKTLPALTFLNEPTEQSCLAFELSDQEHEFGVKYRRSGDSHVLIEYGAMELDLALRFRIQVLADKLKQLRNDQAWPFLNDLTPGIRSLQVHYDPRKISQKDIIAKLIALEEEISSAQDLTVKSRIVKLPLSWDDPSTKLAIEKYMNSVRPDAPWCPSNIEFIRRINGLDSIEDVKRIVFEAKYLVMGLGDVYLGAPVSTPLDPRHRLVTTKYNPARTWTPENAVGIGGAYMCVYGMEGPGGYQFVGRTIQMWNAYRNTKFFPPGKPWLLDFFDQIQFYPVSEEELAQARQDFPLGRYDISIEETTLSLKEYQAFLAEESDSIDAFRTKQQAAFEAERQRWEENGQANYDVSSDQEEIANEPMAEIPEGFEAALSPITGSAWKITVKPGDKVEEGDVIAILETMKIEIPVEAETDGVITEILINEGDLIQNGQALMVMEVTD